MAKRPSIQEKQRNDTLMTILDKFMEKAREIARDLMLADDEVYELAANIIATALQAQDQESRKSERERCAGIVADPYRFAPYENPDFDDLLVALRTAILSERTD